MVEIHALLKGSSIARELGTRDIVIGGDPIYSMKLLLKVFQNGVLRILLKNSSNMFTFKHI